MQTTLVGKILDSTRPLIPISNPTTVSRGSTPLTFAPMRPGAAGVARSPPSQRYSSRGSAGCLGRGAGAGALHTGPHGRPHFAPLEVKYGQGPDPMLAAQSRPTSPAGPAWISSAVGLRT